MNFMLQQIPERDRERRNGNNYFPIKKHNKYTG